MTMPEIPNVSNISGDLTPIHDSIMIQLTTNIYVITRGVGLTKILDWDQGMISTKWPL